MSLTVQNISKFYANQKALDNVSFTIKKGEIVGFLGPNGAGKSTMMKILTTYINSSEGKAFVNEYDVSNQQKEVKKSVGYLPEHNPLYLDMYVKEYLEFNANIYKVKKERINDVISQTGLTPEAHKKINQLSKGYRQRLGLANALLHNPDVLILDEPTTGLDPNQLEEIRNLIKNIGKEKTIMLSTHIMQEVEAICDKTIIINRGTIVANDKTQELQAQQKNQIVLTVEFDKVVEINALQKIEGVIQVKNSNNNVWLFEIANDAVRNNIFQYAMQNDMVVLTMQKETQSLESVFKRLTS